MTVNPSLKITFSLHKQQNQRVLIKMSMLELDRKLSLEYIRKPETNLWLQWGQCALPRLLLGVPTCSCNIAASAACLFAVSYSNLQPPNTSSWLPPSSPAGHVLLFANEERYTVWNWNGDKTRLSTQSMPCVGLAHYESVTNIVI